MTNSKQNIFEYLDYRSFLRDYYVDRKENKPPFSYRAFSQECGLRSPNFLKLVIDGERNLSADAAMRIASACNLSPKENDYFQALVAFNQAKDSKEKNSALRRLRRFRKFKQIHKLQDAMFEYYSNWYVPAIRELITSVNFQPDPGWICQQLLPPITKEEAEQALEILLELDLIRRTPKGKLKLTAPLIATEPEAPRLNLGNFHRAMMQRASEAIDQLDSAERDISSLTLCLDAETLHVIKTRIQRFRRELLELSADQKAPGTVIQVNFQLFPLSKDTSKNGRKC